MYDYYGSQDGDLKAVSETVAAAVGAELSRRESSYIGEYYQFKSASGEELAVRANLLTDEDGEFYQWPEYSGYVTVVYARAGDSSWLDETRAQLAGVAGLVFLAREDGDAA